MFDPLAVITIVCLYMGGLFFIALRVERKAARGVSLVNNPLVYSLSLAIYCTSWTFYGSVGNAAQYGMLFLTFYLGPMLMIVFWRTVLGKLVRIKNAYRITSIADFISARYNKSEGIAALATAIAVIGVTPYIALQLKAILSSFEIITGGHAAAASQALTVTRIVIIFLLIMFTIIFGVRRLDPTERHQGMVMAVAVESMVKLTALLAVGIFVTYFMYDGIGDIFERLAKSPFRPPSGANAVPYSMWMTYLILSMSAILFLPRQFHVSVVENFNERHIGTAMWLFPLYMLLMTFFVYPIAAGGILSGLPVQGADFFVLRLPFDHGSHWLSLFVFVGGFSAAASMIMISSMTLSTMITNHLLLPLIDRARGLSFLRRYLLHCRWFAVAGCILTGYWFVTKLGSSYFLVSMGMLSFAAVLQFAPPILGGIFWKKGNKAGAFCGLTAGFLLWLYSLLLPAFVKTGWIGDTLLKEGPFGIGLLRPESLLGVTAFDPLSHAVFWSLAANIGFYLLGSLYFRQSEEEEAIAEDFVTILAARSSSDIKLERAASIDLGAKVEELRVLLHRYFSPARTEEVIGHGLREAGIEGKKRISLVELVEIADEMEKLLAGSIGASAAHNAIRQCPIVSPEERRELSRLYSEILADLKLSPADLKRKIDYYQERESLLQRQARELEERVRERTAALTGANEHLTLEINERKHVEEALKQSTKETEEMNRELTEANKKLKDLDEMKSSFLSMVSHELRTPLTSILGFTKIIRKRLNDPVLPAVDRANEKARKAVRQMAGNLDIIIAEGERLTSLINDLLDLAKMEAGKTEWRENPVSVPELIDRAAAVTATLFDQKGLVFEREVQEGLPEVKGDGDRLLQVVINLLSNAVKFTDQGQVTCQVRRAGDGIEVSVADRGRGIAPGDVPKVFEKFRQVGDTLTDKPQGTGLGLPICRQIVEHHGGKIWVASAPGEGSTFSFTLPLPPGADEGRGREREMYDRRSLVQRLREQMVNEASLSGKKVLIADDDAAIRLLLRETLETEGYSVSEAVNGLEAVRQAKDTLPDLIILDVMMPEMNGFDAAAVIRNDPATMRAPILILSVLEDRDRGCRIGVDRYLTKPVDTELLLREAGALIARGASSKKVMVVDEDESAVRTLTETLEAKGCSVVGLCSGQECVEKAREARPDMIIIDRGLSEMHDVVRTLRLEEKLDHLYFVFTENRGTDFPLTPVSSTGQALPSPPGGEGLGAESKGRGGRRDVEDQSSENAAQ